MTRTTAGPLSEQPEDAGTPRVQDLGPQLGRRTADLLTRDRERRVEAGPSNSFPTPEVICRG
jgi:hypothetical protein